METDKVELLRSKISMYLRSGVGDIQGRQLLENASQVLGDVWTNDRFARLCTRMESVVRVAELSISDGK